MSINPIEVDAVVIASGGTKTPEINLNGRTLLGINLPAAFTGTSLTFEVASEAGGTYGVLQDDYGNQVTAIVAQGKPCALQRALSALAGWQYIKIVSGATEGADRTLKLHSRQV